MVVDVEREVIDEALLGFGRAPGSTKEAIKVGALAYLMMMPNKEWSDQNGSVFYKQQFIELSTKAKTIAEQGFNLRKSFRVKPNYF